MTHASEIFVDQPLNLLVALRRKDASHAAAPSVLLDAMRDPRVQQAMATRVSPDQIAAQLIGQRPGDGEFHPGLLSDDHFDDALRSLEQAGLLDQILFVPGMENFAPFTMDQHSPHHRYNVFEHTLLLMKKLRHHPHTLAMPPDRQVLFLLAALLHDIGKRDPKATQLKEDGTRSYHGHEESSAEVVLQLGAKWKLPADDAAYVHQVVRYHMEPHSKGWGKHDSTLLRFQRVHATCWQDIIIHAHMDAESSGTPRPDNARYPEFIERTVRARQAFDEKAALGAPVLDGHVILEKFPELTPGPWMKWILQRLSELASKNPELTEDDYVAEVLRMREEVLGNEEFKRYRRP